MPSGFVRPQRITFGWMRSHSGLWSETIWQEVPGFDGLLVQSGMSGTLHWPLYCIPILSGVLLVYSLPCSSMATWSSLSSLPTCLWSSMWSSSCPQQCSAPLPTFSANVQHQYSAPTLSTITLCQCSPPTLGTVASTNARHQRSAPTWSAYAQHHSMRQRSAPVPSPGTQH